MGVVTIPMALLTLGSLVAAVALLTTGHGDLFSAIAIAFAMAMVLAYLVEMAAMLLDLVVHAARARSRSVERALALLCGAGPMIVVLGWGHACFARFAEDGRGSPWLWLVSYGVATGPWTLFAGLVGKEQQTLAGLRAYAGHLAYWLLSALTLFGAPPAVAAAAMVLPALLPGTVGTLLASADRAALRNVRV